ncbi:BMC domain-containing protein [Neobacillus mesonae]|uniref:BMC domain-containing protein n=1 Tax=Neobacillus mesonae TaxID=1193713 RepID=A0A3T0HYH8_9BACI|nr:BMC domain-containing protein [Neobacillus mesonae]AZU62119.1 BMC domain-containing protein [Neobacillus mesonae]
MRALGLIETVGYTTAVSAADAAVKAAAVEIIGIEKVIGVSGYLGVTIQLGGDVGAVQAAVDAGKAEGERVGKVISANVIARAHDDVNGKLLSLFNLNKKTAQEELETINNPKSKKTTKTKNQEKDKAIDEVKKETKPNEE